MTVRVAVPGAAGRMGQSILRVIAESPQIELVAAIELPTHPDLGKEVWELAGLVGAGRPSVLLTDKLDVALEKADVIIDFTTPATAAWRPTRPRWRPISRWRSTPLPPTARPAIRRWRP